MQTNLPRLLECDEYYEAETLRDNFKIVSSKIIVIDVSSEVQVFTDSHLEEKDRGDFQGIFFLIYESGKKPSREQLEKMIWNEKHHLWDAKTKLMEYKVVYRIDVDAENPLEAAKQVYGFMKDGAKPFLEITDKKGKMTEVDLENEL